METGQELSILDEGRRARCISKLVGGEHGSKNIGKFPLVTKLSTVLNRVAESESKVLDGV